MKKTIIFSVMSAFLLMLLPFSTASAAAPTPEGQEDEQQSTTITRDGTQPPIEGDEETFTGDVTVQPLFEANEDAPISGGLVTFQPGARTAWHTHPTGQRLVITEGTGWIQEEGGPVEEVSEGDVVWFPPNVRHWHGASSDSTMSHLALTGEEDGEDVDWMEHVSDEEYQKGQANDEEEQREDASWSEQQEQVTLISAFTAVGEMDSLEEAIHEGLDSGLTINEVKEVLVQLYAYAGFPRSINAINLLMDVVDEREAEGIEDEDGPEASPIPEDSNSIEMGTEVQTELAGEPVEGPLYDFAPVMDDFLKGHLFGDIFARDVLDYETRELATIAALANMGGVDSQLQSHLDMGLNAGLTEEDLEQVITVFESDVDQENAENVDELLQETLDNRE
ncbi:(R)-mandelonitrile lyase [Tetragenococcus muriaticus]|uniref:(R)-mandelonitrile lyase n=1 Tax=Tetragenococcus muriaticus TaxID=64642 RepID=UPI0003FEA069|nr:carboxymuconolactone decarboxylase family protein [Tetragenococcus muriaticus]GMA47581.1 hypothetical protein GCM10025854_18310 [Tetragenococcus muriaticus]